MANSRIYFKSEAGGTTVLSRDTTATSGNLVLPAGGNIASVDTAVTDNAIVRYDGTTGKVQNSGVIIDDSNNIIIPGSSSGTNGGAFVLVRNGASSNIGIGNYSALNGGSYDSTPTLWCQGGLNITDNTTSRIKIDAAGNVGIGVTPSAWGSSYKVLEIKNNGVGISTSGGAQLLLSTNAYDTGAGTWKYGSANSNATLYSCYQGSHSWLIAPSGTAGNAISWTNAMTLDANGNVGIGVTPKSSGQSFEISSGGAGICSQSPWNGFSANTYYNNGWKYASNGVANQYEQTGGTHIWKVAPSGTAGNAITWTNAMTLDASGKLSIGAATGFTARMSMIGDYNISGDNHIALRNNSVTNYGNIVFQNAAGTQVGYIQATATATAYVTSSDYRLKDDIKPMIGSIERLMELKPCNFVWKETGYRVDGFIAHEVQEVVPEAATGVKDEMMEEEYEISPVVEATYDEEGNELTPRVEAVTGKRQLPKYQGIDQSKLVPLLTSALQDAILKIESLERRIEILEGAK